MAVRAWTSKFLHILRPLRRANARRIDQRRDGQEAKNARSHGRHRTIAVTCATVSRIGANVSATNDRSSQSSRVVAGVLVGGRSRRMGRDKALIDVGGESLLERTVRIAQSQADDCLLVGDLPFVLPPTLQGMRRIPDAPHGAGPMAGLAGLMELFAESSVLLLACDMPQLSVELIACLKDEAAAIDDESGGASSPDVDAIVPETLERELPQLHPCCAIYRPSTRRHVESAIGAGRFGMIRLIERMHARRLRVTGEMTKALLNWNTPLDLLGGKRMG